MRRVANLLRLSKKCSDPSRILGSKVAAVAKVNKGVAVNIARNSDRASRIAQDYALHTFKTQQSKSLSMTRLWGKESKRH